MPTFEEWSYYPNEEKPRGCDGRTVNVHLVSDFC